MLTNTATAAPPATEIAVAATRVARQYGDGESAVHALRGVTLKVPVGQFTAVMGPSGSGKSTLMHILAGLDTPTSGEVTIAGQPITKLDDTALTKLRRDHIGFVFQFFNLLPMLTAEENILLPLSISGEKPDEAWLEELLKRTGIGDRLAVSERAVQKHVTAIFAKFGLAAGEDDNRRILAVLAFLKP